MSKYRLKTPKEAEAVVGAFRKIEDTVTGTYRKIEDTVVGGYKKIEERFVDAFLEKVEEDGERPEQDKAEKELR